MQDVKDIKKEKVTDGWHELICPNCNIRIVSVEIKNNKTVHIDLTGSLDDIESGSVGDLEEFIDNDESNKHAKYLLEEPDDFETNDEYYGSYVKGHCSGCVEAGLSEKFEILYIVPGKLYNDNIKSTKKEGILTLKEIKA